VISSSRLQKTDRSGVAKVIGDVKCASLARSLEHTLDIFHSARKNVGAGNRRGKVDRACDLNDVSRFQNVITLIASQILMAIAVIAVTCAPIPEPAPPGPLPLLAPYPVIYTAPYVKVFHPVPVAFYKWIHPGSPYVY